MRHGNCRIEKDSMGDENRPVKDVAKEMTDLTDQELDAALDPLKMTKGGFSD